MPVTAIHPGEHLAEESETLKMSAAELARELKVPTNRITGILNGQRAITGDTALRLGHFFGTSAEFWLKAFTNYAWQRRRPGSRSKFYQRLRSARRLPTERTSPYALETSY